MTVNDETKQLLKELLDELRTAGLIGFEISAHRAGKRGPRLDIWKGPQFYDPTQRAEALATLSERARSLFEQIVSGQIQLLVDQWEPGAARNKRP